MERSYSKEEMLKENERQIEWLELKAQRGHDTRVAYKSKDHTILQNLIDTVNKSLLCLGVVMGYSCPGISKGGAAFHS
jgi:hypothetical protein